MTDALWYAGRATGVTALVLFTVAICLGMATRRAQPLAGLPRFAVADVHRSVSLTATALLVVHVTTLLADPYAQLRLVDTVLPFASRTRPFWTGIGVVASDLVILVVITSLLRTRLSARWWRWIHRSTYALWPLSIAHAIGDGTNGRSAWMLWLVASCILMVAVSVGWAVRGRIWSSDDRARPAGGFDRAGAGARW
jgi:predicted ferric reductase